MESFAIIESIDASKNLLSDVDKTFTLSPIFNSE